MIYVQAVLAQGVDGLFWNKIPSVVSLLGCLCIMLSLAISILLGKHGMGD